MSFYLSLDDVPDLARGAAILGTGGGGDPLIGRLLVEECLKNGKKIEILDPTELDDDDFVISTAMMGAPTVVVEKVPAGTEAVRSLRALEKHLGKTADATIPMECGGLNSMIPLVVAAEAGIPVVDGDGMGEPSRSFKWKRSESMECPDHRSLFLTKTGTRASSILARTTRGWRLSPAQLPSRWGAPHTSPSIQ